jgi:hypothetical protein
MEPTGHGVVEIADEPLDDRGSHAQAVEGDAQPVSKQLDVRAFGHVQDREFHLYILHLPVHRKVKGL